MSMMNTKSMLLEPRLVDDVGLERLVTGVPATASGGFDATLEDAVRAHQDDDEEPSSETAQTAWIPAPFVVPPPPPEDAEAVLTLAREAPLAEAAAAGTVALAEDPRAPAEESMRREETSTPPADEPMRLASASTPPVEEPGLLAETRPSTTGERTALAEDPTAPVATRRAPPDASRVAARGLTRERVDEEVAGPRVARETRVSEADRGTSRRATNARVEVTPPGGAAPQGAVNPRERADDAAAVDAPRAPRDASPAHVEVLRLETFATVPSPEPAMPLAEETGKSSASERAESDPDALPGPVDRPRASTPFAPRAGGHAAPLRSVAAAAPYGAATVASERRAEPPRPASAPPIARGSRFEPRAPDPRDESFAMAGSRPSPASPRGRDLGAPEPTSPRAFAVRTPRGRAEAVADAVDDRFEAPSALGDAGGERVITTTTAVRDAADELVVVAPVGKSGEVASSSEAPQPTATGARVMRARTREAVLSAARESGDVHALRRGGRASVDLGAAGHLAVEATVQADRTDVVLRAERDATARVLAAHGDELARELRDAARVTVTGPATRVRGEADVPPGRPDQGDRPTSDSHARDGGASREATAWSGSSGGRRDDGQPRTAREAAEGRSAATPTGARRVREGEPVGVGASTDRQPVVAGRRVRVVL